MKIVYLITKSNWGGAQRYVYDLATSFASKGHEVVGVFGGEGELSKRLSSVSIKTRSIQSLTRDIRYVKEWQMIQQLYRVLKEEKPDILHLNSSKAAGIGGLLGRLLGVPCIVFTVHGAPFREDRKFFSKVVIYFFTWLTCLFAHKIITVSKQDEADIGAMFFLKKKVVTVYSGLAYENPPLRDVPKTKKTRIVTVGELTKNKGYSYGIEVAEILKKKGFSFLYTIIGEGEDRKKIEEHIAMKQLDDVVVLSGYQDARSVLHNFDIYFLPSVKEGLPYILLEAGKASLPVVATITGGVPEIIRHEETGLLAQPKDVIGLSNALAIVMRDRNYAKRLGQTLHSHIVQNFSYSKMLVETAKVYGLIEEKGMYHKIKDFNNGFKK